MMVQRLAVWHGSDQELRELRDAVNRHCTCPDDKVTCAAHKMLSDQKVIDHLEFVRRCRRVYQKAEFDPRAEWFD